MRGRRAGGKKHKDKPKNFLKAWKMLLKEFKDYKGATIIALILSFIANLLFLMTPKRLGDIANEIKNAITGTIDYGYIQSVALNMIILLLIGAVLLYAQEYIIVTVVQKLSMDLRNDISQKINRIPLRFFDNNSTGDILSRVTNDVDLISQTLYMGMSSFIGSITSLVGSLYMMITTNLILTGAAVGSTLIGFVIMFIIMGLSQKYFFEQQSTLGELNGYIEEAFKAHPLVKTYNAKNEVTDKFNNINERLFNSAWKAEFLSRFMHPVMNFIGNFGYVAIAIIGAMLVSRNVISFGIIVSFMMYIRQFTHPLTNLAQIATTMQGAAAAGERVYEFLREEELEDESDKESILNPKEVRGEVEFEHVSFGYNPGKCIINDFSVDVKGGQKVAIVGPTGAGKTTLVNLLMKFYNIDKGRIRIDGVDIDDLTRKNVAELFCMVLQDTWIFEGTVYENIAYNSGKSKDEVIEIAKSIGLHHFIQALSDGYDTVLNTKVSISQGQRQLITIARAMAKDAPMLILDEATSSVDTRTELVIQRAMDKLMKGKTSFVIAHRISTIVNADRILVLDEGDIIESGTHDELISKKGFYYNLYNSQFEEAV
ncbi:ABC transporter ATP-binding protein [Lagierella sp.]|uniref:ABC transporter ATP-binding protein n=1 Tax=Lagierella sp. TaxID=2849657 RepID=UPI002601BDF5|nr:ABC transporter ATP-binding protein [Lagierella sp.]